MEAPPWVVSDTKGSTWIFRPAIRRVASSNLSGEPFPDFARACYKHLAGQLAVEFNRAGQKQGLWTPSRYKEYALSAEGVRWLAELGIETGASRKRGFARACLDWSERRHHVSGVLGGLLFQRFLELKWITRISDSRAVRLTFHGREQFSKLLGLQFPRLGGS